MLEEQQFAAAQIGVDHVSPDQRAVGAGHHGDHVLAVGADEDQRRTGRGMGPGDARQIDAASLQQRERLVGEGVLADRTDHPRLGAGAGRGQRLVRALAARGGGEAVAGNGLAGTRKTLHGGDEIEIDGPYDSDHERAPGTFAGKLVAKGSGCQSAAALGQRSSWPASQPRMARLRVSPQ